MILMQTLYTGDRPSRFEDPWTAGVSISVIDCAALRKFGVCDEADFEFRPDTIESTFK